MTPKCLTFHQQRTRSADASNIADVKTSINRRQSDGHPLITMLRGVHEQTNSKQHATTKSLWQRRWSPARPGACGRRARKPRLHAGCFGDLPGFFGLHSSVFSGYTPLFAARSGVKLPICQFCSTCVLQICSMGVLQRNNKQNQTTVRSKYETPESPTGETGAKDCSGRLS